jgi:hypothetical protein
MRLFKFILTAVILVIIFSTISYACWVALTTDEMIEQSEYVAILKITDINTVDGPSNTIIWNAVVDFVIKGEDIQREIEIYVSSEKVSTHFDIKYRGDYVLIFLEETPIGITPMTPDTIIGIEVIESIDELDIKKGSDLAKHFVFSDYQEEMIAYLGDIENIIDLRDIEVVNIVNTDLDETIEASTREMDDLEEVNKIYEENENEVENSNKGFVIGIFVLVVGIVSTIVLIFRRKRKS